MAHPTGVEPVTSAFGGPGSRFRMCLPAINQMFVGEILFKRLGEMTHSTAALNKSQNSPPASKPITPPDGPATNFRAQLHLPCEWQEWDEAKSSPNPSTRPHANSRFHPHSRFQSNLLTNGALVFI